jgi:hypothetical protein
VCVCNPLPPLSSALFGSRLGYMCVCIDRPIIQLLGAPLCSSSLVFLFYFEDEQASQLGSSSSTILSENTHREGRNSHRKDEHTLGAWTCSPSAAPTLLLCSPLLREHLKLIDNRLFHVFCTTTHLGVFFGHCFLFEGTRDGLNSCRIIVAPFAHARHRRWKAPEFFRAPGKLLDSS